ncbi:helix-turn-helix transcriptional regulator [Alloactinosynnema sp. L-07]|uniref:helix-turn-helix domain-containing protein n=1 Tax=Alloactinosynnema sp. L-07 TaxID=1653480 RepID=UPI0006B55424|nr:helix-turn-helix transcriptional regulator [Alloactinosynnema sp. L-07]
MVQRVDARIPNAALIRLREDAGLAQQDLAQELNDLAASKHAKHPQITKKTVGRWERGEVALPQPFYRRLLAEYFDVAVDELGFRRVRRAAPIPATSSHELLTLVAVPGRLEPRVHDDQRQWRHVRTGLNAHRHGLAVLAQQLYPDHQVPGLEATGVIAHPSWIPEQPVPIGRVALELDTSAFEPVIVGDERETAATRPLASTEARYRRYHHAVRDLATPRLFENRLCFRLLGLDWAHPTLRMQFGQMGFFDSIDINEALAHETALHHLGTTDQDSLASKGSWRRLAFRKLIGDPADLSRRPLMGAIGTLTIRGGDSPRVVLHQRDGTRVAGGGGMAHLLPAGIFQPSSYVPAAVDADFSLWRNIQREYAEELLGHDEYDGSGRPIHYDQLEPFITMDTALADGHIRVWCLGVTLDALTLCGDILTVAVIDPDLYDDLFGAAVNSNAEGTVPAHAFPFEANTLLRLRELGQLSPGAAAALHLAWHHRATLLHTQS